ncbi:hypothetical protein [Streptomyces sp. NPDC050560]|uniref:hypothetical protein n=1 Tax=Streptomyces sp. NPDC050560 TaxID=3365630 RepID=UPI0037A4DF44
MGIESDRLVFDYLSRVGDVAQQRQLPSATRMRLVTELRGEIDRHRSGGAADSPAAVRRILSRLGSPDAVVEAAGGSRPSRAKEPEYDYDPDPPPPPRPAAPSPPPRPKPAQPPAPTGESTLERVPGILRRLVPGPRPPEPAEPAQPAETAAGPEVPEASAPAAGPPRQRGRTSSSTDWWRVDGSPSGGDGAVPGFVGGVEIPEILGISPMKRPGEGVPLSKDGVDAEGGGEAGAEALPVAEADVADAAEVPRRRLVPRLWPARVASPARWTNPLLLIAAVLLVWGALFTNWWTAAIGWVIAYASRRLTPGESKAAVFVVPGLAVAGGIVWLWGRGTGRWGSAIAKGHMNDALADTWPGVLRGAAIASALFLVWRSQRGRS